MSNIRLLVIDDSATVRAMIEMIVEQEPGCKVVGVAPGIAVARQLLDDLKPNLVTLDLNMPGGGGLQFLDELSGRRHAPIIVLSSATTKGSDMEREAIARGADACFDKTRIVAEGNRFRAVLRGVLARREKQLLSARNVD